MTFHHRNDVRKPRPWERWDLWAFVVSLAALGVAVLR